MGLGLHSRLARWILSRTAGQIFSSVSLAVRQVTAAHSIKAGTDAAPDRRRGSFFESSRRAKQQFFGPRATKPGQLPALNRINRAQVGLRRALDPLSRPRHVPCFLISKTQGSFSNATRLWGSSDATAPPI